MNYLVIFLYSDNFIYNTIFWVAQPYFKMWTLINDGKESILSEIGQGDNKFSAQDCSVSEEHSGRYPAKANSTGSVQMASLQSGIISAIKMHKLFRWKVQFLN